MIIFAILLFGMLVGAAAHFIIGDLYRTDWSPSLLELAGSFIGGLGIPLATGDGFALRPIGVFASLTGAIALLMSLRLLR